MNLFQIATRGIDLDTAPITPDDAPPRAGFQFEAPAAPQQRLKLPTELDEVFALAAAEYDIDPNVLRGVAYAESRFNPDIISGKVKSPAGAIGLMQFMPETAKEFGVEPTDPTQSIIGAAAYLRKSLDKFGGDYERAVASYNWGPNRKAFGSDDWVDKAPEETRKYLGTVFDAAVRFRDGQSEPTAPPAKTEATQLPAGVTPSTAGAGRGSVSPGMKNTKLVRSAVPEMTAESLGRDVASGVLQIGPTAVQGVGDLLSLATGNRVGSGLREFAKSGKQAIQEVVGSERAQAQAQNLAADMADDSVGLADLVANNKGALSDQILPTLGSMAIPLGAAGAAGKLATAGKAAQGLDKAAIAARVASAQQAAGIGATAAQNAASTFAELLDKGVPMQDAYVGAGITVPFSLIAGKLTGGGAEGALIRGMGPAGAARGVAEAALKAPAREGLQEGGEALGQVLGEAGATSTLPTLNSALKQVGTEALLGAVVGGGMSGAQQVMTPRVEAQPITPTVPQVAQPNQAATPPNSDATKTQAVDNIAAAILEAEGATSPVAPVQPTEKQAASFAQRTATPTPLPGAVPTAKAADADVRSLVDDIKKKRAQDAEETAQIQQMLAEDDAKAEALASSSMEETARGQAAQIAIQARARLVDDLVSSYAEPSEFFASRVLPAVDRQLAVLGRPPLAKDERARVDALLGSTRAFIRPSLPSAPESAPVLADVGADNAQLESLIKPKRPAASGIGAELAAWKARQQSAKPVEAPVVKQDLTPAPTAPVTGGLAAEMATLKARSQATTTVDPAKPAPVGIGRDNTPLAAGGKPFKTKAEADTARKLQPMMRVKKQGKGFVLVEKTAAQIAAQEKSARRNLGSVGAGGGPLSAHAFLASQGGLSKSAMADLGFDRNVRVGSKWLFTNTGMTLEGMTEALQQNGYVQGTEQNPAIEMVRRSANGQPQYTAEGWDQIAQAEATARFEDHLAAQQDAIAEDEDFDPFSPDAIAGDFEGDDLVVAGYDAKKDPIKLEVNALLAKAEALGIDTDTIKETAYEDTKNESEQAYFERVRDELTRAINASAGSGGDQAADGNDQSGQGSDAQRGGSFDSRQDDGREGAPGADGEGLTAYTPEEVTARQDAAAQAEATAKRAEEAAARAEAAAKRASEIAQRSVAAADTFELGGNAEDNLSGQQRLLESRAMDARLEAASEATLPVFAALGSDRFELSQAIEDASRIAGFSLATAIEIKPLGDRTIQHFDPATGKIAINSRRYITRGLAAESLLEEWIHALDNASQNRQFSAGSAALELKAGQGGWEPVGDIAKEAMAQRGSGSIIDRFLEYPLGSPDLSASRTQAELFARLGVLYIAHGDVMQRAMPITYEAYHAIFSTIRSNEQLATSTGLQGEVRRDGLGGRAEGVRDSRNMGRADGDAAPSTARREGRRLGQSDIDAFQRASVRAIGARADGGIVQGTLSATSPFTGLLTQQQAATTWDDLGDSRVDELIYEAQDDRIDLKRVQENIAKAGRSIREEFDARTAETLLPGRLASRTETFMDIEVKPLMRDMAANNVTMEALSDYMLARHAPERNAQIAKVNPDMPDGGAGTNSQGVLMTTQAANDHIAALTTGKRMALELLARRVDTITKGTRELLVAEGLEKADTVKAWEGAYKHYVPLFRDESAETPGHPIGSGISVTGTSSKRATGSTKEVTNMLAHVLMQREAAITRAEKNRVAMSLYGMALSHPNKGFWSTVQPNMKTADIVAELQRMGVDPMDGIAGMDAAPTIRTVDERTNLVVDRPNPMYKKLDNAIVVKVNGEDRVILFNTKNARAMRLAESLKNQHMDAGVVADAMNSVATVTRFMASMLTQYNPAFGMVNAVRDVQGALVNLSSTELAGKQARVLADTPAAVIGIARDLRGDPKRTPWSNLWVQFQEDGGRTGYRDLVASPYERTANIEKDLKRMQNEGKLTAGNAAHAVLDVLGDFNDSLENGVRLAAYKAALDKGMSRPQAAKLARELTVDFNRKGRTGRELGKLYAFLNASIQGNARTLATLVGKHGGKVMAGGFALGVLQALMLAAAGFEEDEIPEFVKARAFIIPMGGKQYVAIPLALGLHVLPNTSRVLTELMMTGGEDWQTRVPTAMAEIVNAANPLGGGGDWTTLHGPLTMVMPTVLDPVVDLAMNRDFTGKPISRTSYNEHTPGTDMAREGTLRTPSGQVYLGISEAINSLSGGNARKAGTFSPTPEEVRYVLGVAGGGVFRETEKAINAAVMLVRGDEIKATQVPLGSRFVGEVRDEDVQRTRFYKNSRKLEDLEADLKNARKSQDEAEERRLAKDARTGLIGMNNSVQRRISEINRLARDDIGDRASLARHDASRADLMRALNDEVRKMEEAAQ